MNILIIGNGFDLAHRLPTSYTDFLKFFHSVEKMPIFCGTNKEYEERIAKIHTNSAEIRDILIKIFESRIPHKSSSFTEEVFSDPIAQEIYQNLKGNIWYCYLYKLYENGQIKGVNWIDFESEISHIVEIFDRTEENLYMEVVHDALRNTFPGDEKIGIFLRTLDSVDFFKTKNPFTYRDFLDDSYQQLRCFIYCMELYLRNYVEALPVSLFSQDIKNAVPSAVLCFNYTHTFFKKYGSFFPKAKIHYIHGESRDSDTSETSNMVLGIDEYYKIPEDCNAHTNYNIYKKFTQRVINETGFEYREWIQTMDMFSRVYKNTNDPLPNNIFVFGHSLDITDKDILKDLIDREGVKTTIFYHDKQQQTQQIANLVKMLGQEHFIKMINSVPQQITFVQQQELIFTA